jgi:AsmA-like C-terminal region
VPKLTVRAARWFIAIFGGVLVMLWIIAGVGSRTAILQRALIEAIGEHLDATVELDSFQVSTFPTLSVTGDGLRVRHRKQAGGPPLIEVAHFYAQGSVLGLLHRPRRLKTVTLQGLRINVPPGGLDQDEDDAHGKDAHNDVPDREGPVLIDHLVSDDAVLQILSKRPDKEPKRFAIHHLHVDSLGFDRRMPFRATLTNPIPRGEIETTGTFGPWIADNPGASPLDGNYDFKHADLNTIDGLGGTLSSQGNFYGRLARIHVNGTTTTPDFSVDVAGQPVPLDTRFRAIVDGTNGDTYLEQVDARFLQTSLTARGAIVNGPQGHGRTVKLDVVMPDGRVEDVMKLAVKSSKPVMVGSLTMNTKLVLPPEHRKVADRLQLDGAFAVGGARFTDAGVQQKITDFSRHGQGKTEDEPVGRVLSDLRGRFTLANGVTRFHRLQFGVPGSQVSLTGAYALRAETLDFKGTLSMQATVSEAVGTSGVRKFLLKMIDPIFRKKGAGAVVPIKISGTRRDPKFGLDMGRVFGSK